jgi:hypothetical protein
VRKLGHFGVSKGGIPPWSIGAVYGAIKCVYGSSASLGVKGNGRARGIRLLSRQIRQQYVLGVARIDLCPDCSSDLAESVG